MYITTESHQRNIIYRNIIRGIRWAKTFMQYFTKGDCKCRFKICFSRHSLLGKTVHLILQSKLNDLFSKNLEHHFLSAFIFWEVKALYGLYILPNSSNLESIVRSSKSTSGKLVSTTENLPSQPNLGYLFLFLKSSSLHIFITIPTCSDFCLGSSLFFSSKDMTYGVLTGRNISDLSCRSDSRIIPYRNNWSLKEDLNSRTVSLYSFLFKFVSTRLIY